MPPSALPSTTQVNPLITCEGIRSVLRRGDAALFYPSKSSLASVANKTTQAVVRRPDVPLF